MSIAFANCKKLDQNVSLDSTLCEEFRGLGVNLMLSWKFGLFLLNLGGVLLVQRDPEWPS
jgi:hypothetical protein